MKLLTIMTSEMEARLFVNHLKAHDLKVVMSGNKEYASIITGQDNGRFEILVTEDDFEKAQQLSKDLNIQLAQFRTTLGEHEELSLYYKKSIIFALMSILVLPLVFNISSIYYLYKFAKHQKYSQARVIVLILISLILNISFGLIGLLILYNTFY